MVCAAAAAAAAAADINSSNDTYDRVGLSEILY